MTRKTIQHKGQEYNLLHLSGFTHCYIVEAKDGKPEIRYTVDVSFSWHCFTKTSDGQNPDHIIQNREIRCFCPVRYRHSLELKFYIQQLIDKKCKNTGKGNFLVVEMLGENGDMIEYEIYFSLRKAGKKQNLKLFVESAYIRTIKDEYRNRKKPIRFSTILFNVKHDRKIRQ